MTTTALVLSIVSLVIALVALFWNIYRDLLLRPRSRVTCHISIVDTRSVNLGTFINITLTNLGPGELVLDSIVVKTGGIRERMRNEPRYAVIINDYDNPMNPAMPTTVAVHRRVTQFLPFEQDCFVAQPVKRIGFIDTLNRYHWARHSDVEEVKREYVKEFGITR